MRSHSTLFWALACLLLSEHTHARSEAGMRREVPGGIPTIAVMSFDVNDQGLKLRYRIANSTGHSVWVCDGIETGKGGFTQQEVYVDADANTLVIRRRLHLALPVLLPGHPMINGRYLCLRPGQERAGSLDLAVPVLPRTVFASSGPDVTSVSRLTVEIGFYNEDLPTKIRSILGIADKLKCLEPRGAEINLDHYNQYFGGLLISSTFGGLAGFDTLYKGESVIVLPWLWPVFPEDGSLKITIDPVSIPYKRTN